MKVKIRRKSYCAAAISSQVPKSRTDLNLTFLFVLKLGTHTKFVRNIFVDMLNFRRSKFEDLEGYRAESHTLCSIKVVLCMDPNSQWNPFYKAFHRIWFCGNKRFSSVVMDWSSNTNDLHSANIWPALEHRCGKQTPSAKHFIFPCEFAVCS